MSIQTHPGLHRFGIGQSPTHRRRGVVDRRTSVGRRTLSILAAVVIEAIVVLAFIGTSTGIGSERSASGRPGSAPFVTTAPEAPPTPRPGF